MERELTEDVELAPDVQAVSAAEVPAPETALLDYLQESAVNASARTGRVCSTFVVDYDEAGPEAARAAFGDVLDAAYDGLDPERRQRVVVDSTWSELGGEYDGAQAFVVVRLPSGHAFADRISLPKSESAYGSERYRAFVDRYGGAEALSTLAGERVDVAYDESASRWLLDLSRSDQAESGQHSSLRTGALEAGLYAGVAVVLLAGVASQFGAVGSELLTSTPFVSPLFRVSLLALLGALGMGAVRTAWQRLAGGTRAGTGVDGGG